MYPYGTILSKELTNQAMLESKAYKTYYAFDSREKTPKPKYVRKKVDSDTSPKQKPVQATKGDGVDTQSKVPNEQHLKTSGVDKGTGDSEDEDDVNDYDDISDDHDKQESDDKNDDDEETDSDRTVSAKIKIPILDQSTTEFYKEKEEKIDGEESMDEEEDHEVTKELYDDVNVNLGNEDSEMTNADQAATLTEFQLTKIRIDKIEKNKSFDIADYKRELCDALVKSYNTDKDIFESYRKALSASKDASKSQHKSFGKSSHAEDSSHTIEDSRVQQDQEFFTGNNDEQLADKEVTKADWFKKPKRPPTLDLYWRRQIIPQGYFINDDLEYLKGRDLSKRYSTYVTKTKAATYDLKSIKDLGPKRQSFYGYASNMTLSKDVYSRRRIIAVTRLKIMKKYDYGHLEEIKVRRDEQKLYTFKEGVESYQKKFNLTKPDTYRSNLRNKTAYTSYSDPHGIIYVDQYRRKRLMRVDELHKFSDGILNDVRSALHDIDAGIRMKYLPMRKWSNLDKKRTWVMVQDIDKQLY
nr:hypothetical protein [Tanacetum cinerariifolium]